MEQIKRVLILSTNHPHKASGVIAYDLFEGFKKNNYSVKLVVEVYDQYEDGIVSVQYGYEVVLKKIKNRIRKLVNKLFNFKEEPDTLFDYHFDGIRTRNIKYSTKRILKKTGFNPDLIVVLFSQRFISLKNFKELQELTQAPIIWQFADMFPFTGGCHYAWDCNGYKALCKECPAMLHDRDRNKPHQTLLKNIDYVKNLNLTIVIGSDWLLERAKQSTIFKKFPFEKIYLSVDENLFKSFDGFVIKRLRKEYNIKNDAYVILIMANYLSHKRKGIEIILSAISNIDRVYLEKNKCHLLIVGNEFELIKEAIPSTISYTNVDFVAREKLPEIYNISNIFVSASLQEVGPYTITESLLCEIPVVSLNHGYANEFVISDKTGVLVEDDSASSLANGIKQMIEIDIFKLKKMKEKCRSRTKEIVSKKRQIEQYLKLMNKIL